MEKGASNLYSNFLSGIGPHIAFFNLRLATEERGTRVHHATTRRQLSRLAQLHVPRYWGVDLRILILGPRPWVKIGLASKSRNSDAFRRPKTKSSFPIAIAPKLLQYGCCNFMGVLNATNWPICALNIGQKKKKTSRVFLFTIYEVRISIAN